MNFTTEQKLLRESVRKLMDTHAHREYVREKDKAKAFPYELYDKWVEAGLLGVAFPETYGGSGGGAIELAICAMEIAYTSADFQMAYAGNLFCGLNLIAKGSEEQRAYWLPKIVSGERRFSISMSEPEAGSDVGALRTKAVPQDDGSYRITGTKIFISFGEHDMAENIIHLVLAKTPDSPPGTKGISCMAMVVIQGNWPPP